jgi:hypothetical protein
MSMIGNFRRLPDADLARLLAAPEEIADYLADEEPPEGFGSCANLDVDKAWHGIHFLLTGTPWAGDAPWNFIAAGGAEIGDVDVGYGPARGFTSSEVKEIARALASLPPEQLASRFDPKAMMAAEIYPTIWDRPPSEDDTLGYVREYYDTLRDFVAGAAAESEAMIVYLT